MEDAFQHSEGYVTVSFKSESMTASFLEDMPVIQNTGNIEWEGEEEESIIPPFLGKMTFDVLTHPGKDVTFREVDSVCADWGFVHYSITNKNGSLKRHIAKRVGDSFGRYAILKSIQISQEVQGFGVGTEAMTALLDYLRMTGVQFLVLLPEPINSDFSKSNCLEIELSEEEWMGRKKRLLKFYKSLGFFSVERTELMFKPLQDSND